MGKVEFRMKKDAWLRHFATYGFSLVLVALILSLPAVAEPSAKWVLEQNGYASDTLNVLMAWNECPLGDGNLVYGMRVSEAQGEAFDLYYDDSGTVLDEDAKAAAGIVEKRWDWTAVTKEAQPVRGTKRAASVPPVPKSLEASPLVIDLGMPDVDVARAEDDQGLSTPFKSVLRIGVFLDVGAPIQLAGGLATDGDWQEAAGGRVWAVTLDAVDAEGLRVHFSEFNPPAGAEVLIYNADDPASATGRSPRKARFGRPPASANA